MVTSMGETDSQIMNYVVRMVIPMKREFARTLHVSQFLHDRPYAIEVIQQAMQSKDARLRDYAVYLEGKMFGARNTSGPARTPDAAFTAAPAAAAAQPAPAAADASVSSDAQLRAKMLTKYKSGLR